jgi:hypothetical protein
MLDSSANSDRSVGGAGASGRSIVPVSDSREVANIAGASREIGALLIVSGIAGVLLPGPVGTPLLILGCVMIWPKSFRHVSLFFARRFPRAHYLGSLQSTRFLSDLERRYPISR